MVRCLREEHGPRTGPGPGDANASTAAAEAEAAERRAIIKVARAVRGGAGGAGLSGGGGAVRVAAGSGRVSCTAKADYHWVAH
jgi:hypothetical protein